MKVSDVREKSIPELRTELVALLKEQFNLRMQKGLGEAPKLHILRQVRRDIARVKTVIREKERQA